MRRFLAKHVAATTGTLSCFDRLLFKGHLPLGYPHAMEEFLSHRGILFKDLKGFVLKQAERLKVHAHAVAEKAGRPYEYFESPVRKDQRARAIAARDGITEGLVSVFATIEPCRSFRLAYGHGRPTIRPAWRKCLFLYFYFLDREFGFCHARVQTWFPFTMQVYVNGHEWLARQMDKRGLRYRRLENAFLWLEDPGRVQRLADRFAPLDWPAVLDRFAHRVNPLLRDELKGYRYYWATHQAEYATDILFTSRPALRELYARLLRHATLCLRAEDVLTFLGRKLHGGFAGEIMNDWKRRWPGARVKHWMKGNWIKMYDKHGCVLRVETVINDPYEFKVRRRADAAGGGLSGGTPCRKAWPFCRAMPPCPQRPIIGTSMRSPSSTIPPLRNEPSIASSTRCGITMAGRRAPSTPRPPPTTPCSPPCSAASTRSRASATARCARGCSAPPRRPIADTAGRSPASSNGSTSVAWLRRFPARAAGGSPSSATPS